MSMDRNTHTQGTGLMKSRHTRILNDLSQPAERLQSETLVCHNRRVHHLNPERLRLAAGVPLKGGVSRRSVSRIQSGSVTEDVNTHHDDRLGLFTKLEVSISN